MSDWSKGGNNGQTRSGASAEELLPVLYEELRRLARSYMANERQAHTLQATALVHEAYLRLLGTDGGQTQWSNEGHFFAAAAEAMRRILIDRARRRQTVRHGGAVARSPISELADDDLPAITCPLDGVGDLLALDEALTRFATIDPDKAEIVKLICFGGLTLEQAAAVRNVSKATAHRHWVFARAWLRNEVEGNGTPRP